VQIFGRLRKGVDPKVQEEKTRLANERELAEYAKAQRRLAELVGAAFWELKVPKSSSSKIERSIRSRITPHYLLLYHQYASSAPPRLGKRFLNASSTLSLAPTRIVPTLSPKLSGKFQSEPTSFTN